jgi:NifU-like protein involved in Fe-S cluster formation
MYDLYHPRIFELASDIAHQGRLKHPHGSSTKVSKICGSSVSMDVCLDGGAISAFGIEIEACALGQAAAAILAQHALGATLQDVLAARDGLRAMLKENEEPPQGRFWELRHLQGVRDYPQRHVSTLLAFDAAVEALEQAAALAVSGATSA